MNWSPTGRPSRVNRTDRNGRQAGEILRGGSCHQRRAQPISVAVDGDWIHAYRGATMGTVGATIASNLERGIELRAHAFLCVKPGEILHSTHLRAPPRSVCGLFAVVGGRAPESIPAALVAIRAASAREICVEGGPSLPDAAARSRGLRALAFQVRIAFRQGSDFAIERGPIIFAGARPGAASSTVFPTAARKFSHAARPIGDHADQCPARHRAEMAASVTLRAMGPTWSNDGDNGTTP